MTAAFIDAHRDRFAVLAMCRVLQLCERSFYAAKARPRSTRSFTDESRKTVISVEWNTSFACYGARRLHKHFATPRTHDRALHGRALHGRAFDA